MNDNPGRTWSDWLYPELQWFPSGELRGKALARASLRSGLWLFMVAAIVVVCVAPLDKYFVLVDDFIGWISVVLVGAIPLGIMWLFHRRMRRCLRRELVRSGVRICVDCGHDLRAQAEARCPECGKPFEPIRWSNALWEHHAAAEAPDRRPEGRLEE